jgi:hypothetical protein
MSRLDKLEKTYQKQLKSKSIKDISVFIQSVVNADITKGKYAGFLIESFLNDKFLEEDLIGGLESTIGQAISLFHKHKSKLPEDMRSIFKYTSPGDLWKAVKQFQGELSGKELKKEEQERIYRETEFVYKDEETGFQIVSPLTKESAQWWGKGTRWCTSAENKNMFERYAKHAPLFIIIIPNSSTSTTNCEKKFQLWKYEDNIQFMDEADHRILRKNIIPEYKLYKKGFYFLYNKLKIETFKELKYISRDCSLDMLNKFEIELEEFDYNLAKTNLYYKITFLEMEKHIIKHLSYNRDLFNIDIKFNYNMKNSNDIFLNQYIKEYIFPKMYKINKTSQNIFGNKYSLIDLKTCKHFILYYPNCFKNNQKLNNELLKQCNIKQKSYDAYFNEELEKHKDLKNIESSELKNKKFDLDIVTDDLKHHIDILWKLNDISNTIRKQHFHDDYNGYDYHPSIMNFLKENKFHKNILKIYFSYSPSFFYRIDNENYFVNDRYSYRTLFRELIEEYGKKEALKKELNRLFYSTEYLDIKNKITNEHEEEFWKNNPHILKKLFSPYSIHIASRQTKKICYYVVKHNPLYLKYVDLKYRTEEICDLAVKQNALSVIYVPKKIREKKYINIFNEIMEG